MGAPAQHPGLEGALSALTLNEKADEILLEGLLTIETVRRNSAGRLVVAHCRSRTNREKVYHLGWNPQRSEWHCSCPVHTRKFYSHLIALQRVTTEVRPREVVQS